jgi:hypothetical protein
VRFEVLIVVKVKMMVFWKVMMCCLIGRYKWFGGAYCSHLQDNIRP